MSRNSQAPGSQQSNCCQCQASQVPWLGSAPPGFTRIIPPGIGSFAAWGEGESNTEDILGACAPRGNKGGISQCCEPQLGCPDSLPYTGYSSPSSSYTTETWAAAGDSHAPSSHDHNPQHCALSSLAIVPNPPATGGERVRKGTDGKKATARAPAKPSSLRFQRLRSPARPGRVSVS